MSEERVQRRLAAILAADVVGYSRLMEADEGGTLTVLKSRRKQILEPLVSQHHGRVFKIAGDGVLVEFGSAVDAVRCAVELQNAMAAANDSQPEDRHVILRIGINLGDVMVEGSDLYGDGINIASRLESLAEPGGVCLSAMVHQNVKTKLDLVFEDLGEQHLKNITETVRAFHVRPGAIGVSALRTTGPLTLPDRPSIAVLPFNNMADHPDQEYFSDGITEDITTELSHNHGLLVIARNSSFQYRDKAIDVKRVGRELGARYVVEGSVRRSGEQVRITAQLIDAATGGHLWAHRYDRALQDIFAIQDEVVTAIVGTVVGQIQAAGIERARHKRTDSMAAYDYFLRGLEYHNRSGSDDTAPACEMFKRAIDIDPDFARAHALLAWNLCEVYWAEIYGVNSRANAIAALNRALSTAQRAVALDGNDALCHCALGYIYVSRRSFELAAHHIGIASSLNPNDAEVVASRIMLEVCAGLPQQALESLDRALRLNPTPPNWYREWQGCALYSLRRYEEAAKALECATVKRPYIYRYLAASYAQMGRLADARTAAAEALRLQPEFTLSVLLGVIPWGSQADRDHVLDGLRKAGLPE
jgi:TolB-like protein/class 3 adenylate cyclase/Flp pilus assembly protein TadD